MLLASILLVFGTVALFIGNVQVSEGGGLGVLHDQMIHARLPWLLILAPVAGAGLGVWSLVRQRRWYKWGIVPVEILFAGLLVFFFTSMSFLPEHRLALAVGDAFPSYSLPDQDGILRVAETGADRRPALYIFYRGDW